MKKISKACRSVNIILNSVGVQSVVKSTITKKKPNSKTIAKRGNVVGFSSHSAQRFRELLFKVDWVNFYSMSITLTVPSWSTVDVSQQFDILSKRYVEFSKFPLIWRKEVQKNKKVHYHTIMLSSELSALGDAAHLLRSKWCELAIASVNKELFLSLHPLVKPDKRNYKKLKDFADSKGCIKPVDSSSEAITYLCDHTSKHKDYQAQTEGRAWGVLNRKSLPLVIPQEISLSGLTERQVCNLLKYSMRMSKKKIPCSSALFGYRLSNGRMMANIGSHIVFSPSIVKALQRLIEAWTPSPKEEASIAPSSVPVPEPVQTLLFDF